MKRSRAVPLILLGTISLLTACGRGDESDQVELTQQTYASREECLDDWGNDERNCTLASETTAKGAGTGGGRGVYVGPRYFWYHSGGYPIAVDPGGAVRPLPSSYLSRPGAVSTATGSTTTTARVSSRYTSGGTGKVSRGGFGSFARSFSGGGG